ncbi:ADP-ribosylglycohydrolase family protein [Deltaproteobacteria bacterium]|nr:ADP-ribosylglycohydrolase family protein [Deltaproteobacteria bacterium]
MDKFPESTVKALIGLACGDAFGAPFEYHPKAASYAILSVEEGRYLNADDGGIKPSRARVPGLYTDDTQQALAMLWVWRQLVLKDKDPTDADLFVQVLRRVFDRMAKSRIGPFGVHRGTGRNFRSAVENGTPLDTAGMGAAMRIGPVATLWPMEKIEDLWAWVFRVSEVTTTNQLSKDAAGMLANHVWLSKDGWKWPPPQQAKRGLVPNVFYPEDQEDRRGHYHLQRCLNKVDWRGEEAMLEYARGTGMANKELKRAANGFAMTGIPWVIHCVREADSYEDAMLRVCSSGGDTDTVAAMAGCLAAVNDHSPPLWMTKGLVGYEHLIKPHTWHPIASEEPLTKMERDLRRERKKNEPKPQAP